MLNSEFDSSLLGYCRPLLVIDFYYSTPHASSHSCKTKLLKTVPDDVFIDHGFRSNIKLSKLYTSIEDVVSMI